jgi:hypothetical protein
VGRQGIAGERKQKEQGFSVSCVPVIHSLTIKCAMTSPAHSTLSRILPKRIRDQLFEGFFFKKVYAFDKLPFQIRK